MDRLQFILLATLIGNILIFYVLAMVWWLKLAPLYKIMIVFVTGIYPIIGFTWYLVVFILERKRMKKRKLERKKRREEKKKKEEHRKKKEMELKQ